MSNPFRVSALSVAVVALASIAFAQTAADTTYTLKPVVKKGDSYAYDVKGTFDFGGQDIEFTAKFLQKVTDLKDTGIYSVEQSQTEMKAGGQDIGDGSNPAVTFAYNADGTINTITGTDERFTGSEAFRAAALDTILVPDKPVKIGDTWTFKGTGAKDKQNAVQVDFKLAATEKVGEYDCIKVDFKGKETEGDAPASVEGSIWLNIADFSMVKREVKMTNYPIPGAPAPLNGHMSMIRTK